ncbi:DUF2294 domain-containing protein [Fictibacillus terranigra]|uniref:Na-translocating system protein MpsC family protein n=1 Tax=Fictibacillus terranigra TaxID=3058424 RepID=A0ABT8E3I6_9BACL|nr:Na-translocating system protein MpsC family protein [Fictibacillus sp. CENA-BCM004]MDN4072468.1 Na-translocating system protein MpsC family protein [Fictibacillus sp. CENA-BCM004]
MTQNIEHQFSMLVREIRKEFVGNGPREISTCFVGSWAVSEMKGNLTNIEKFMMGTKEGEKMVHEARTGLVKKIYTDLSVRRKFEDLAGASILRIFSDIDIEADIAMTIFVFDRPLVTKEK